MVRKLYDINDIKTPYDDDRYLLIGKINMLENKQLRGIVPIVKSSPSNNDKNQDNKKNDDNQKLEFDLYELSD